MLKIWFLDVNLHQNEDDNSGDDDDSETPMTEMRFAPDNTNNLDAMFHAMNQCQALHPDPQDSFSDGEYIISAIANLVMTSCGF